MVFSPDFDINRKALRFQFHHPQAAPEPESREALCGGLALSLNWKARGRRDQLVHFLLGGWDPRTEVSVVNKHNKSSKNY